MNMKKPQSKSKFETNEQITMKQTDFMKLLIHKKVAIVL